MSRRPFGQGVPTGTPHERVQRADASSAGRGQRAGVPARSVQGSPQSESERRYADRIAQRLPESFRAMPSRSSLDRERDDPPFDDGSSAAITPARAAQARLPVIPPYQQFRSPPSSPPTHPIPQPPTQSRIPRPVEASLPATDQRRYIAPEPGMRIPGHSLAESSRARSDAGNTRQGPRRDQWMDVPRSDLGVPQSPVAALLYPFDTAEAYRTGRAPLPPMTAADVSRLVREYHNDGSERSSLGSIPDFPLPLAGPESAEQESQSRHLPVPQRLPLGPPPSARRGPSSYYSQQSHVGPIVEESERASHGTAYTSSSAMPSHGIPDYYMDDIPSDEEFSLAPTNTSIRHDLRDDTSESGLVRRVSLGPARPTLIQHRSQSPNTKAPKISKGGIVAQAAVAAGAAGGAFAAGLGASRDAQRSDAPSQRPTIMSVSDPSSSQASFPISRDNSPRVSPETSDPDDAGQGPSHSPIQRTVSPLAPRTASPLSAAPSDSGSGRVTPVVGPAARRNDPRFAAARSAGPTGEDAHVAAVLGGLKRGGALDQGAVEAALKSPRIGLAGGKEAAEKPRLDTDVAREPEVRSSITSLPELIKRATRLAANLDRGKTASRAGLDWFIAEGRKEQLANNRKSNANSLSDILASFPPPGVATTQYSASPPLRPGTGWPEYEHPDVNEKGLGSRFTFDRPPAFKHRRRCCGMPLWAFVILCILVFFLVAAAVVIPVTLTVVNKNNNSPKVDKALAACQKKLTCQNGGSNVVTDNGTCTCLCANGFTGTECTTEGDSSCTSTRVGSSTASVGNAIPRLVRAAPSQFSVPLSFDQLLGQFSAADLTCTTQNALVTLDGDGSGITSRVRRALSGMFAPLYVESEPDPFVPAVVQNGLKAKVVHERDAAPTKTRPDITAAPRGPFKTVLGRAADGSTATLSGTSIPPGAHTVNGILVASSPSAKSGSSTPTSSAASSQTTKPTAASDSGTDSQKDMDFSRIVILFVLQETGNLTEASDAQNTMSDWYSNVEDPGSAGDAQSNSRNISLGSSGWSIDLTRLRVTLANGTMFGKGVRS